MYLVNSISLKKTSIVLTVLVSLFVTYTQQTYAGDLIGAKDTVTTSRPSASSPLSENGVSGDSEIDIFNNGSRFLASDSAKIIRTSTTANIDSGTRVNSQSSGLTTVVFGETLGTAPQAGTDVLYNPITSMHTIQFTTPTGLNSGDDILITFPILTSGDANNPASPSATTFQLNHTSGTVTGTIMIFENATDRTGTSTFTVTHPTGGTTPRINISIGAAFAVNSTIKIYLGCSAGTSTSCTTEVPRIINPTKSTTAGNDDAYKIRVETQDSSDSQAVIDTATISVGIIESVTVRATVDPTLTFSITGLNTGVVGNTGNTSGCLYDELTNSGVNSTATDINLGTLANTPAIDLPVSNIAGQRIDISTNATSGYALTATSSSSLLNPTTGFFLRASLTPVAFPIADDFFGLHACGQDVVAGYVESGASSVNCETEPVGSTANECRYAWPTINASTSTTPLSIALDSVGPIGAGSPDAAGDGSVSISYAAGVDVAVPPGEYRAVITYIATPAF